MPRTDGDDASLGATAGCTSVTSGGRAAIGRMPSRNDAYARAYALAMSAD